ncbi:MAG: hypothetical protein FD120_2821, partial [Gammaproteobacteria bacterium]
MFKSRPATERILCTLFKSLDVPMSSTLGHY